MSQVRVHSEIAPIEKVIIHTPGRELELMTPDSAEEVLYDDILNLQNARQQHAQLSGVLKKVTRPFEVRDLLRDILEDDQVRQSLVEDLCRKLDVEHHRQDLLDLDPETLTEQLITGTPIKRNTLQRYLSKNQFAIPPLPNLFFTRDAAMVVNNFALLGNMATLVRTTETYIMRYLFLHHPELSCADHHLVDTTLLHSSKGTFEGGDLLILRKDVLVIGMSERTNPAGIDYLIEHFKKEGEVKHLFVVMLPKHRAWIHLDMVFTMIDYDKAVVFPPLINERNAVDVIHVDISKKDAPRFSRHDYLLEALKEVDIHLEPVYCGGTDPLYQQREQWQSGANFFTIAPGKIIGYGMNYYTYEELARAGIPRIEARDVLDGTVNLDDYDKYAIAMAGNELTRGGGGCRCMTMPIVRADDA
ncbi:MAG: arginine deiminase [Calditrichaeota bacterium]|nr:MAG: arginine deiminase [Calditrichota bacterium]